MGENGRIPHSEPLRNKMCGKCSLRLVWLLGSYILTIPGTLLLHNDAFTWLHKRRHCGLFYLELLGLLESLSYPAWFLFLV